ncbi:MAG: hypothetical protein ABIU87_02575 [Ornithinibacter sp.]
MSDLGSAFARAIALKNHEALLELLAPQVDFRALTPARCWDASTADRVEAVLFESWFGESVEVTALLGVGVGEPVEDTHHVSYRLALRTPEGEHTAEQQVYYRSDGQRITYLRIMSSGFRAAGSASVVLEADPGP